MSFYNECSQGSLKATGLQLVSRLRSSNRSHWNCNCLCFLVFCFDFSVLTFSRSAPTFSSYLSYRPHGRYLVLVLRDPSSLRSVGMTASRFRLPVSGQTHRSAPTVLVLFYSSVTALRLCHLFYKQRRTQVFMFHLKIQNSK